MTYARVQDGIVIELFAPPEGSRIEDCFHPGLTWVDCSAVPEVAEGWTYDGTTFAPAPPPAQTADQVLAEKIGAGITITCNSNPSLHATYALDETSAAQIFQIGLYASQFGVFPSGQQVQPYPDKSGMPHMFSVDQFIAFLRVVAPLISNLNTQASMLVHGAPPAWPDQSATIA